MKYAKQLGIALGVTALVLALGVLVAQMQPTPTTAQGLVGGQIPGLTLLSGAPNVREWYGNFGEQTPPFTVVNSGAGAGTTVSGTTADSSHPYVTIQTTGTTSTGRTSYGVGCSGGATVVYDTGVSWHYFVGVMFDDLSDGTETYIWRSGFKDVLGNAGTDGCYFQYDSTASANWQCVCAANATRTTTTSSIAVVADTYQDLRMLISGTGQALFFVENVQACSITTNIPSGTTRATGSCSEPVKSAGTTPRTANIDYMLYAVDRQ